ncbi:hypothetical protein EDB80DRAFT_699083 [Ilyonectria destructans]|nr:hypothetical protein EDB80DRAFT_699083 [Ilyonectria destructans]
MVIVLPGVDSFTSGSLVFCDSTPHFHAWQGVPCLLPVCTCSGLFDSRWLSFDRALKCSVLVFACSNGLAFRAFGPFATWVREWAFARGVLRKPGFVILLFSYPLLTSFNYHCLLAIVMLAAHR